jgi:hypothetical protein
MGRFPRRGRCRCLPGATRRGGHWCCLQNCDQFVEVVHSNRIRPVKVARVERDSSSRLGETYIRDSRHRHRCHGPEPVNPSINIRDGDLWPGLLHWVCRHGALQAKITPLSFPRGNYTMSTIGPNLYIHKLLYRM